MAQPDNSPLLPTPFQTMQEGHADPAEVAAVQRFLMRLGPSFAMRLMPHGADGNFGPATRAAIEAYQEKFHVEVPVRGVLDARTAISMNELRGELAQQDRKPDALAHIITQMPDLPTHAGESGEGPQARLRSVQLHARDAADHLKAEKPDPESIKLVQEVLQSRGYDLGPAGVDGKPGKYFKAALIDYQRDAGLLPIGMLRNGGLDPATHELLKMDDERLQQKKPGLQHRGPEAAAAHLEPEHFEQQAAAPAAEEPGIVMPPAMTGGGSIPAAVEHSSPTAAFTQLAGVQRGVDTYKPGEMIPGLGVAVPNAHVHLPSQSGGFGSINVAALFRPVVVAPVQVYTTRPVFSVRFRI